MDTSMGLMLAIRVLEDVRNKNSAKILSVRQYEDMVDILRELQHKASTAQFHRAQLVMCTAITTVASWYRDVPLLVEYGELKATRPIETVNTLLANAINLEDLVSAVGDSSPTPVRKTSENVQVCGVVVEEILRYL